MSARIEVSCLPQFEFVAQIEFGPQAAHAVMEGLELLGDIVEMAALDIHPQGGRQAGQIVQRDGDGNSVRGRGDADFIVGRGHLDGEADDLPRRAEPLHDQRQREGQHLRGLQHRNVERGGDRGDLRIRENPQLAG